MKTYPMPLLHFTLATIASFAVGHPSEKQSIGLRGRNLGGSLLPSDGSPPQSHGCVAYRDGNTDDQCRGADPSLFDGSRFQYTYACNVGFACCQSTDPEYLTNILNIGDCRRNYVSGEQGCVAYKYGTSDSRCDSASGFSGFGFSYKCTEGLGYGCCNARDQQFLSNVLDLGQCERNTVPTPRPTLRPNSSPDDGGLLRT